jgi:hypothetical protein
MRSSRNAIVRGPNLNPSETPVALFRYYFAMEPVTLVLPEKVFTLSGDDCSVKDMATGETVVRCKGKVIRDHKSGYMPCESPFTSDVTDASGKLLFSMRNTTFVFRRVVIAEDDHGNELFRIKRNIGCEWTADRAKGSGHQDDRDVLQRGQQTENGAKHSRGQVRAWHHIMLKGRVRVARISRKPPRTGGWITDKQAASVEMRRR